MPMYTLTAFDPTGETVLDENFEAPSDGAAKEIGASILNEKGMDEKTHRCISPQAKLILFHR